MAQRFIKGHTYVFTTKKFKNAPSTDRSIRHIFDNKNGKQFIAPHTSYAAHLSDTEGYVIDWCKEVR